MADNTKIEWTDSTWNIITGCSVVSAGCKNCYAMKLAGTRLRDHPSRKGLTTDTSAGPVWTGEVRFNQQWLDQPLRWKRPRMIFVCAHGDLFHESVPDEWIDRVFAVMALCPQHTMQCLTKRPGRMRAYMSDPDTPGRVARASDRLAVAHDIAAMCGPSDFEWPLRNFWAGTSVENQEAADERIPLLLQTPAAVRWVSVEPLLGAVELSAWLDLIQYEKGSVWMRRNIGQMYDMLDWVVVGGESGRNARPMHPAWARSLRDQCKSAGVPFLFKQWGGWQIASAENGHHDCDMERNSAIWVDVDGKIAKPSSLGLSDAAYAMVRTSKKSAGRLLDGVLHDEYPVKP